jgi:DNA-binding NarL/FixJ family response regulator
VRVVIAEDQALLRTGLTRILVAGGFEVIAAVDNAADLRRALADPAAEVAVLDVRMPPTHTTEGLEAAVEIRTQRPGFPVLVLSQYVEALYARELLADGRGGVGYLLKDRVADVDAFLDSVRRVAGGATVLDPEVVATLVGSTGRTHPVERLTAREREALELMAQGRSNAAIAARMFVTEKAVGKHTNNIFAKLGLPPAPDDNRRVLAVLAYLESPEAADNVPGNNAGPASIDDGPAEKR